MGIVLAFYDYIPVVLYLVGAIILLRKMYHYMSKGAFAVFSAGAIFVFIAGVFKATWKVLYNLGICDFVALNNCFFPMQTVGWVLLAAGIIAMLCFKQGNQVKKIYSLFPVTLVVPVLSSNMIFVVLMVLGVAILYGGLAFISFKKKNLVSFLCYIIAFIFIMTMGYLSSRDFTEDIYNLIAELVNTIGQGLFLFSSFYLFKFKQDKSETKTKTN